MRYHRKLYNKFFIKLYFKSKRYLKKRIFKLFLTFFLQNYKILFNFNIFLKAPKSTQNILYFKKPFIFFNLKFNKSNLIFVNLKYIQFLCLKKKKIFFIKIFFITYKLLFICKRFFFIINSI